MILSQAKLTRKKERECAMFVSKEELAGLTTAEKIAGGGMSMMAGGFLVFMCGIALMFGGDFFVLTPLFGLAAWLMFSAHRCFQATKDKSEGDNVVVLKEAEQNKLLGDAVLQCAEKNPLFGFFFRKFM